MFNWLTPNIQKGIALSFLFSWFLAQGRFALFWQALSGQVTLSSGTGGVGILGPAILPDITGSDVTGGEDTTSGGGQPGEGELPPGSTEEPPPVEPTPPAAGELPPGETGGEGPDLLPDFGF